MRVYYLRITILIITTLIVSCDKTQPLEVKEPLRPVRTIIATAGDGITGRDFPGVVVAQNKADLSYRVSGKITELLVREGDKVKSGQIIARLDQTDFKIDLEDKQASYKETKANFERAAKLIEPGHISQREFDEIKATYGTASAHLKAAKQNLIYTELKAPFKGSITKIYIENFEEIQAKSTIARLQNLATLEVEIDVPESLMIRIKRGKSEHEIFASFDAIKDKSFPLKLREVSAQADDTTHTYKIRFSLPTIKNYTILPGMTATVIANYVPPTDAETSDSDITIPSHAVLEDSKGRFVYIAELIAGSEKNTNRENTQQEKQSNTAIVHRRDVTTSRLTTNGLIVTSGINVNDRVITAGMSKMREGMQVKLMSDIMY